LLILRFLSSIVLFLFFSFFPLVLFINFYCFLFPRSFFLFPFFPTPCKFLHTLQLCYETSTL
jgi:hypothetical protein